MADLPLFDQLFDRAGHVLDRHVGINAVLVKQVDVVAAQPAQRAPSSASRMCSGRLSSLRSLPSREKPNLVAMTTWSRSGWSASATTSSLW